MEDPEWKIQPSSSKEDEGEGAITMVKWILNAGRKIAVTGIIVSSAPVILPPFVVLSAMGVAVSVPFGLLFAGYACTNKLMTILLPPTPPPPPLMLEYYHAHEPDPEHENDYRQLYRVEENEDGYYTDKEDNEVLIDDVNHGVDTEIGLGDDYSLEEGLKEKEPLGEIWIDENGNGSAVREDYVVGESGCEITGPEVELEKFVQVGSENDRTVGEMSHVVLADGNGTETVFNSREVGELVPVAREVDVLHRENVAEEEGRENMEDIEQGVDMRPSFDLVGDDSLEEGRKRDEPLVESGSNENKNEPKFELVGDDSLAQGRKEEESLVENENNEIKNEQNFDLVGDDSLAERRKGEEPLVVGRSSENENVAKVDEDAKLKDEGRVDDMVEDDYVGNESGLDVAFGEVKDVETTKPVTVKEIESEKIVEAGSKNGEPVGEIRHVVIVSEGSDENNNSREVEELDLVAREVKRDANKDERNVESDEKVVKESMGTLEISGGNASKNGREDAVMDEQDEHLVQANADSLEIVDGERTKNGDFQSVEVVIQEKENDDDDNVDVLARSPSKQAPMDAYNAEDASKIHKKMLSRKENLDDEKMWEKIRAMRTIVGYKAPSQPTCIGELKALYVFTGVEPPASSKGDSDSDLDEVNAKLKFLMAIVGVK